MDNSIYYTVYKTTNLINGKTYIGQHRTSNINDDYLGSGNLIKLAIKKYGKHNFKKSVMFLCNNAADMDAKERELVSEEFVKRLDTYNLRVGGSRIHITKKSPYTNTHRERISASCKGRIVTPETKAKISVGNSGKKRSTETKAKMSAAAKVKTFSKEHRANMSLSRKGKKHTWGEEAKERSRKRLADKEKIKDSKKRKYITPWGIFNSVEDAAKGKDCTPNTIRKYCKNPNMITIMAGKFVDKVMVGMTYGEIGFNYKRSQI